MIGTPFEKGHIPWNKSQHIAKICLICGNKFEVQPYRKNVAKYCSRQCRWDSREDKLPWNKGKKLHYKVWNKGLKGIQMVSEETKTKISESMKGMKHPNVTNEWRKGKPRYDIRGENHPFWKGGVSRENKTQRQLAMETLEYKLWREAVFKRDEYSCIKCFKTGKTLQADHIKPWAVFPELRYAIDNGQTLCKDCHAMKTKSDKFMYFNNKQMEVN